MSHVTKSKKAQKKEEEEKKGKVLAPLYCTIRHNKKEAITAYRFLVKASPGKDEPRGDQYDPAYFLIRGINRADGGDGIPRLMEFTALDRAYSDEQALKQAKKKLRGNEEKERKHEYFQEFAPLVQKLLVDYFWLPQRNLKEAIEDYTEGGEFSISDADTISEYNLSECSGDTEAEVFGECEEKVTVFLAKNKVFAGDEVVVDEDDELRVGANGNVAGFADLARQDETVFQMLSRKYPTKQAELRQRRIDLWREKAGV